MLSVELNLVFNNAVEFAREKHHEYITTEHILYFLLINKNIISIIKNCGADTEEMSKNLLNYFELNFKSNPNKQNPIETLALNRVIENMIDHLKSASKLEAEVGDMLVALFDEKQTYSAYLLALYGIKKEDVIYELTEQLSSSKDDNEILEKYTINLVKQAKEGNTDVLIGRVDELKRLEQILCRRKKNNPLLVGEAGVGKTAIVDGLAQAVANDEVPEPLLGASIFSLEVGTLLSGTKYRGDFEKRLKEIISEIEKIDNAIVFIDEIHTIVGAGATSGGSMDLSNLLKPALASGKLRLIGATTYAEYRNFLDKDKALSRRFAKIDVNEPSIEDTYKILLGLKKSYETHHEVKFPNTVLKKAAELSKRYINDRFLPDSAIDLIDETGAFFRINAKKRVNVRLNDIEETLSKIANIPKRSVNTSDKGILKNLDSLLKAKIFGQDEAIIALSKAIRMSKAGLSNPNSPIGSFLFTGPTGVGKTELAKQLALILGVHFERFDMSEYMEKHSISRLIGAPPGYVGFEDGGQLTESIRKHPYCVLLLDEIEKAHEDLINVLLQVFDNATLTDNNGAKTDFRNTIIIMTSNLGTKEAPKLGFEKNESSRTDEAVKAFFSPEFRNRLDAIINFNSLQQDVMLLVVQKLLDELNEQMKDKKIIIKADNKAKEYLAQKGFSEDLGARVARRIIQEEVSLVLSDFILFGDLQNGGVVNISFKRGKLNFKIDKNE